MDNQQIESQPIESPSTPELSPKNQPDSSPQDPPTIISDPGNSEAQEQPVEPPPHPYAQDLHLLSHPIFSHKEDPIIQIFTQPMEDLFAGAPQEVVNNIEQIDQFLLYWTFGLDQQAFDELMKTDFCNQTACGKLMEAQEVYFRCLDCDMSPHPDFYTVLCAPCFEKSDHKGHRILVCSRDEGGAGTCDCGDPEVFNSRGFCTNHQPKPVDIPKLFAEFPSDVLSKYQTTIKKTLYAIISFLEILFQAKSRPILVGFSFIASRAIAALFEFCIRCETEFNQAFLPIFWTTLKSTFEASFDVVLHDCQDSQANSKVGKVEDKEAYHQCSCTLLGNIFRVINLLPKDFQQLFKRLLIDSIKDASFREYLTIEFTKYLPFLYHKALPQYYAIEECSPVTNVYMQLYQKDETLLKVLESGHLENFFLIMKEHIFNSYKITSQMNVTLCSLRAMMEYLLLPKYKTAQKLLSTPKFLEDLLDQSMIYKTKSIIMHPITITDFDHQIPYSQMNLGLDTERQLIMLFEHAFLAIENLPVENQDSLIKAVLQRWIGNLLNAQWILSDENQFVPIVSVHCLLERVFTGLLVSVLKDNLSTGTLEAFLKKYLPENSLNEVAEKTSREVLNTLGLFRYLHITWNYKQGALWSKYYYLPWIFFETDVVTVQAMTLVSDPINLFQNFAQHFFKYPCAKLRDFFTNPANFLSEESDLLKRELSLIQEFLQFIIYLMNDELCLLNLQNVYEKKSYGEIKFTSRNPAVLQKFLINLLQGYYWISLADIKSMIASFIYDQAEADQILSKITTYDEQNHKLRIKEQYEGKFDPYLFYRVPSIKQSLTETVLEKSHKVDLISGVYYPDLPLYLKEVQKKFYSSSLVDFLSLYVRTFNPQTAVLIPSVLKLILLNLQVLNENYSHPENEELKKKVQENYMTPEFTDSLVRLLANEAFSKDCEPCLLNIQALLKALSSKLETPKHNEVIPSPEIQQQASPSKEEEKKRLAKERMEKLKNDFMMKQAQFSEKNHLKSEESKESSPDKVNENNVCQHCREEVHDAGDEYGLLTYMTFTNNFYDCEAKEIQFKEQDYSNFAEADWWPVISSCGHYYHKKCFDSLEKTPLGTIKNYFYNKSESFCRYCRALCNNFLTINPKPIALEAPVPVVVAEIHEQVIQIPPQQETTAAPENNAEDHAEDQENTPPVSPREGTQLMLSALLFEAPPPSFMDKIQDVTLDLKKKLTLAEENLDNSEKISPEIIFRRAYSYFIEAFHLQTNAKTLSKMFELYNYFLKAFEPTFQQDRKTLNQNQDSSVIPPIHQTSLNLITSLLQNQEENTEPSSVQIDDLAIQVSTNILQETLSVDSQTRNPDTLITQQTSLLKDYILIKLIQLLPSTQNITDYLQLYEQYITNKTLILERIPFALQKISLATQLNKKIALDFSSSSSELFRLLLSSESQGQEVYLTNLLHSVGIVFSFDQFIQEILSELPKRPETHIKLFQSLATSNKAVVKRAPKIFKIPEGYPEFNSVYFATKCNLCDKFSKHMFTAICLICGEAMCVAYCQNGESGNLNRHAKKYHMGVSLFIDIQHLSLRLINNPFNLTKTNIDIYIDKLGQSINDAIDNAGYIKVKELDFGRFKLSADYGKIVKELIEGQAIRKEIFSIAIKTGDLNRAGYQ